VRGAFARAAATLGCGFAALTVSVAIAATAPPTGGSSTAQPIKDNLYGTKFVDSHHGWVVGAFGVIAATEDGGRTWQPQVSHTTQQLYDVDFVDDKRGWTVGRQGLILHTTNGGAAWEPQVSGTENHLFSVDFVDEQYGVAVGDFGTILVTRDGGAHWENHSLTQDVVLYDVALVDRTHGWIAGELGTVLTSTDGGQTWTKQDPGVEKTLFGAFFSDAQHGWVVGIDALILHTADGGQTWQVQNGTTEMRGLEQVGFGQAYDNPSLYAIAVIGTMGVAVGEIGAIYLSSDGGQTWQRQDSADQPSGAKWFRSVSIVPGTHGAIVGAQGARERIVDGRLEPLNRGTRAAEAVH
jgi:photosystem II stability/assembly factor-like uncharacterized protein